MDCHPEQPFTAAQEQRIREIARDTLSADREARASRELTEVELSGFLGLFPLPVAADPNTSSRPLAGGPAPRVTGGFVDDRASDGEADALGRQVQGVAVHDERNAA